MRTYVPFAILVVLLLGVPRAVSAEDKPPAAKGPVFTLSTDGNKPEAPKFSDAQMGYVQSWIRQKAPECPVDVTASVAVAFLEELQIHQPEKLEQLLAPGFPARELEPTLLRIVGTKLTGAAQAPAREEVARRRIQSLVAVAAAGAVPPADTAGLVAKIKESSAAQYRRLVEGRMEDDDLLLLLKKVRQPGPVPKEPGTAAPKVLSGAEIVSEFQRHNATGSSLQRLQAYVIQGHLKPSTGEEEELIVFKMRPDRFRLVIRSAGLTRYILAGSGGHYWQQAPGQPPRDVPGRLLGTRLYLAEFVDPLLADEGYRYDRLEDGATGDRKFYRIAVLRPDGSRFVACIEPETFREIAREETDKSSAHYSDFREISGVTYAFREEVTDAAGHKGVLDLTRITPNPGLIEDFFNPPGTHVPDYFEIEQSLAGAPPAAGQPKG